MLDRASFMVLSFCAKVFVLCAFYRVVCAKVKNLAVDLYSCLKSARTQNSYTEDAKLVVGFGGAKILLVGGVCNVTKIAESIIKSIAIDMVNLAARAVSRHIQPCKSMGVVSVSIDAKEKIFPIWPAMVGPADCLPIQSCKKTSYGVIVQQLAQTFCGNILSSHAISRGSIGRAGATFARFLGPLILRRRMVMCNG